MLSNLQTKKLTRLFQVYDIDDDGQIEASDFERVVENVRLLHGVDGRGADALRHAYMKRWERLRDSADLDGDRGVSLEEWLGFWERSLEDEAQLEAEVRAIADRLFSVFDLDEDDRIGRAEFADFYGVFGLSVSLAETVFVELDANGDGAITRDELVEMSRQFYDSDDVESPGNYLFGPYGA